MKKKTQLWKQVLISMVLGVLMGHFFGDKAIYLKPFGTVFINMIKMVVIPLIFFSILNGITSLSDVSTFSRIGTKAFLAYTFTTMFAVVIGLTFANIFKPGIGVNVDLSLDSVNYEKQATLTEILVNVVPSNPFKAMAEGNILQVVLFAFFTGISLMLIGEKGKKVKDVVVSATHLVFKMIELVIKLTPYGVFALMSWVVSQYGLDVLLSLGNFVMVVIGALVIQYILFGVMILVFARLNPIPFYKKMIDTQLLAFATVSSKATLGTATKQLQERIGVSRESAAFVLPLGASMNMDATSIYLGICCVFFAQIVGVELSFSQYMVVILTSTIGSIGAAGFPGGSMVMMGMVLSSVGLPLEGISLIIGVDRFLEMLRTTINITGDCTITLIVDASENRLNRKLYNNKNA